MLTQSLQQLAKRTMRTADVEGETALDRHPMVDIYDLVNAGIAALHLEMVAAGGASLFLATMAITTTGSSLYALPVDFAFPVSLSIDGGLNGSNEYLFPFGEEERAELGSESSSHCRYRLSGDNVELLPAPAAGRNLTIWYSRSTHLTGATQTVDVGARFDDYVACYAAREIATKDRAWDLADRMGARLAELTTKIRLYVKQRLGVVSKVADTWSMGVDRHGRRLR